MIFGVCYYPEHWPEERWSIDAEMMRAAGISVVRIGEFAWAKMQPGEAMYDWGWLDRAIDTLAQADLRVVLGTPTAAPPAWLVRAYPEILPVDARGMRRRFGSRRHYCANAPIYREHTRRIVSALAERYGRHPALAGWQIDNEFGCHDTTRCYCDECARGFRLWLRARYTTLDALNTAWGTVFWSQTYTDWGEIDPPLLTVTEANPSHVLDYERFASDSVVAYQQMQIDLLRPASPDKFITTNLMGHFPDINYHALTRPLDFASWDSYPTGYAETAAPGLYLPGEPLPTYAYDAGDPDVTGFCHSLTRGFKQAPFWVMEQQCGHINWGAYNPGVRPGTVRLWTWHALASGAEAVVYFRWRATVHAQEQHHSGLLMHDASPASGYRDLQAMQAEKELIDALAAQPLRAEVAILVDYEDLWALQLQPHRAGFDYWRHVFTYYRALQRQGQVVDLVSFEADLSRYRLVIAPTAFLVSEARGQALQRYVENGGRLLLGVRSGFKTPENKVVDRPLPGRLRELAGVTVSEWHALPPGVAFPLESSYAEFGGSAAVWAEALRPNTGADVRVLARYAGGPFEGAAALTEHTLGQGACWVVGWLPDADQAAAIARYTAYQARLRDLTNLPAGLVRIQRGPYTVLLNFTEEPYVVELYGQEKTVEPRGVAVYQKDLYNEL